MCGLSKSTVHHSTARHLMLNSAQWVPEAGQGRKVQFLYGSFIHPVVHSFNKGLLSPKDEPDPVLDIKSALVNKTNSLPTF